MHGGANLRADLIDVHSVSKEMHHEFIDFPCDPGSESGDPGRVIRYYENLKLVAKNWIKKSQTVLPMS